MPLSKRQKVEALRTAPELAIFSEIENVNKQLEKSAEAESKSIAGVFERLDILNTAIKALVDKEEADLNPNLEAIKDSVESVTTAIGEIPQTDFTAVKTAVEAVTEAIKAIPEHKEMDMSGIETLLGKIANKEHKEMDMSEMKNISAILGNVLKAIRETSARSETDEKLIPDLAKIREALIIIDESIKAIGFDYDKLGEIIKKNINIKVLGGGGGGLSMDTSLLATSEQQLAIIAAIQAGGTISTNNSTSTPLGIGATYTGIGEEVKDYVGIGTSIVVDRSGTINVEFSTDNINWNHIQVYPITVATPGVVEGFFYQFMCEARYFRFRYVNGATAQGTFKIQTIFKRAAGTSEVQAVNVPLLANTDALVTKGVIYGVTTAGGGGYVGVKVAPSGAIQVGGTVDTTPTTYTTRLDEQATYTYSGKAVPGTPESSALWQIQRYLTVNFSVGLFADGNANFDNVWDNRNGLTYI